MAKGLYKEWLTEDSLTKLQGWAREGFTDEQIAKKIGISRHTLGAWKKKYGKIDTALKRGKLIVDYEVENALLSRALGTTTTNITYKMMKIDKLKLKAMRAKYVEQFKKDNPGATDSEATIAAAENVPTYEEIPLTKNVNEIPPDTSAAIFWLKNRRPDIYRDQTFRELNEAQRDKMKADARKALADAKLAEMEAKEAESATKTNTIIVNDFDDLGSEENADTKPSD